MTISLICLLVLTIVINKPYVWMLFALAVMIITAMRFIGKFVGSFELPSAHGRLALSFVVLTVVVNGMTLVKTVIQKNGPISKVTILEFKDNKTLKTSDSLIYVGKVEKFTFLYNKTNESPEIISNDEIKSIKWQKVK